ncbi:MAG: hypothetical protein LQ349_006541 [Xanthoria aureola]|nr:MAG: hypothetical protein LQ349_006541 [Xanthoria aureola]
MAASSPLASFHPPAVEPSTSLESSRRTSRDHDYKMMVLRFSHDTTEDEVDRQFLRTALDLGINVPQNPTTTLDLVTKNVSALALDSTPSAFPPPPSRTSDSTHPTSCSSSEQRGRNKTSSLTSSSMTSAPSSINSSSSRKSSYTKIKSGIRRISTLKRRKTSDAVIPPIPISVAAIKTLRPLPQHRSATVDQVHSSSVSRTPVETPELKPSPVPHPHDSSAALPHQQDDPAARHRSLGHPLLKQLRWSQIDEQRRFVRFEVDQHRLMRSRQEDTRKRLLNEHPQRVRALQHRHTEALSSLEHRHLSSEIDLERTLELERQACATRLKHMQAYCSPRSAVEGMPNRIVTQQNYRQLDQQYLVLNGMENLHASRINVLREKQAKQLERIIAKQELEVEQADKELATTMQKLETTCELEMQMLAEEFAERRKRLVARWSLAEAILRKRLEKDTGEAYGALPSILWDDERQEVGEHEDHVDGDLARDARMAYDASALNMI